MADKAKFVREFRGSVTELILAFQRIESLVNQLDALGWTNTLPDTAFVQSDMTQDELFAAIDLTRTFRKDFTSQINKLTKLLP